MVALTTAGRISLGEFAMDRKNGDGRGLESINGVSRSESVDRTESLKFFTSERSLETHSSDREPDEFFGFLHEKPRFPRFFAAEH